jgi:PLP dependent protein
MGGGGHQEAAAKARRCADLRFGKMDAVGAEVPRQRGVASDGEEQAAGAHHLAQGQREIAAAGGFSTADDDQAAAGQGIRGGHGIGQARVVGHKDQRRQRRTGVAGEGLRRSCQPHQRGFNAHLMSPVAANLDIIKSRIAAARKAAVAPAPATHLIAVSKTHPAEAIREALQAGHRLFGESKVQEALAKWPALKDAYADAELHMIGGLQTNKVKEAVGLFDAIHSVDRVKLARAIASERDKQGRNPKVFVQVNIGEEPQKSGVTPRETLALVQEVRALGLDLVGLMGVPPLELAPAPYFGLLKKLAGEAGLPLLSMGMSDDFEIAIQFGATHVRVGTAIFGARDYGMAR